MYALDKSDSEEVSHIIHHMLPIDWRGATFNFASESERESEENPHQD